MADPPPDNNQIAHILDRVADLLEDRDENPFRVRSYRHAAETIGGLDTPAAEILKQRGLEGLKELEGIGPRLAASVREIVDTGRLRLLDQLQSETDPTSVLAKVPGIGKELAGRIHSQLKIDSLEELEQAAHDGRLEEVEGMGEKRLQGVRDALAGMLSRSAQRRARHRSEGSTPTHPETGRQQPPVGMILHIDQQYRTQAEADKLRKIAPRRFNPENKAWLPIMRTEHEDWSFTALFSNTARAHELGKTHDWVVIYFESDGRESQCTVVTAGSGPLEGKRVVRGREKECREYYQAVSSGAAGH